MIPVKLENELRAWISNPNYLGISWHDTRFRKINAIIDFLNSEHDKILFEMNEKEMN
jgi:hypothetical protein